MKELSHIKQNSSVGVLCGVGAAFAFAVMGVMVKQLGYQNIPVSMMLFFRFGISLLFFIPWLMFASNFKLKVKKPVQYALQIFSALAALFCVFYVIKFIPLVDVLLLNNTALLFVPFVALLLTGAKTSAKVFMGALIGFIGVIIILNPQQEIFNYAALIALASGILSAISIVQIRLLSKTNSTQHILFYYFLVSTVITGIVALFEWHTPENVTVWLLLLGIGLFGTLYQVFAILSYVMAPVRIAAPLMFLTVIFGGLFDWIIWDNIPSLLTLLAAVCVVTGILVTVYFGQQKKLLKNNNKKRRSYKRVSTR